MYLYRTSVCSPFCFNDHSERKLEYLHSQSDAMASTSSANKKRKKQPTNASPESEPTSKKAKRGSFNSNDSITASTTPSILEQKSKEANPTRTVSDRRTSKGIDLIGARRIQTGLKGARGEVIRRTVFDGALRIDEDAYKVVREALTEFAGGNAPLLNAKPEWRKYLPMNALIRPTLDTQLGKSIIVTELTEDQSEEVIDGTKAANREIGVLTCLGSQPVEEDETLRIRGGGEDEINTENQGGEAMEVDDSGVVVTEPTEGVEGHVVAETEVQSVQMDNEEPTSNEAEVQSVQMDNDEPTCNEATKEEGEAPVELCSDGNDAPVPEDNLTVETPEEDQELAAQFEPAAEKESDPVVTSFEQAHTNPGQKAADHETNDAPTLEQSQIPGKLPQSAPDPETSLPAIANETAAVDLTSAVEDNVTEHSSELPSSGTAAATETTSSTPGIDKSSTLCDIKTLEPTHQLSSSLYNPTTTSNEVAAQVPAFQPSWYDPSQASDFEQRSLPEWFNQSAPHRTPASYIAIREQILDLAKKNANQYITATALRRSITCDSGSIMRLHSFLTYWSFINSAQVGESAPSEIKQRNMRATWNEDGANTKRKFADVERSLFWSPSRIQALEISVLQSLSRRIGSDGRTMVDVDWGKVCAKIGGGVTAKECQYMFIQPPKGDTVPPASSTSAQSHETFYSNILDSVRPEVLKQVIDASLNATQDLTEAKKASLIGAVVSIAAEKGVEEERQIRATLMDIVDQRVQRLENRIALMDDVEALLEAERVSLELERRDMYTTRCRLWFGDGSS